LVAQVPSPGSHTFGQLVAHERHVDRQRDSHPSNAYWQSRLHRPLSPHLSRQLVLVSSHEVRHVVMLATQSAA